MAKHRDQARFDRAGWRLTILLPCWVVQTSLLLVLIGTSAYLVSNAMSQSVEVRGTAIAWECINIIISVLSILLTAYEILRTLTESLTPKAMMMTNLCKLIGVVLSMIMDGMVTGTSLDGWTDGTLVVHGLLLASILILGSYAAWKWKCLVQYDDYHLPGNVKPFGFKSDLKGKGFTSHSRILSEDMDWDPDLELGNHVEIMSSSSPGIMAPSPEPTPTTATTPATERGSSFAKMGGRMTFSMTNDVDAVNRGRANTASSLMALDTAYDPSAAQTAGSEITVPKRPASYISITGSGNDRRTSYNHTRDTSFDEYVHQQKQRQQQQQQQQQQRASQRMSTGSNSSSNSSAAGSRPSFGSPASPASPDTSPSGSRARSDSAAAYRLSLNLKNDIDDALSTEFGWGTASRSSSQDSTMAGGQPPTVAVGSGAVQSAKNVRDSLGRAPSDGSEHGALGNVAEFAEHDNNNNNDDDDNDDEESDGERDADARRKQNVDEASRALLGEGLRDDDGHHPELLRPGRPGRPQSEAIAFVITPPPPPKSPGLNSRTTWGSAYAR